MNAPIRGESLAFADVMRDWLHDAPWLAASVIVHALIALLLANMEWRVVTTSEIYDLVVTTDDKVVDPLPPPEKDEKIDRTFDEVEPIYAEPVVNESTDPPSPIEDDAFDDEPIALERDRFASGFISVAGPNGRTPYARRRAAGAAGRCGGPAVERAVRAGLDWLARHQHPEGFWDCDGFGSQCADLRCTGQGQPLNDVGVTGLALLAFLGQGNTVSSGEYRDAVKKGVRFLCSVQDPHDGLLTPQEGTHWMYNHALGTLALTEAYNLSRWPLLKKPAQRAVEFVLASRNPGRAWRYNNGTIDPAEQNDVSVTGWMIMCLASARDASLCDFSTSSAARCAMVEALAYIDAMTDSATGRTGYTERGQGSSREAGDEELWPFAETEAMTAVAMLGRIFAGHAMGDLESQERALDAGAALLRRKLPRWDEEAGTIDFYYWYYGSYAMFQMAGGDWRTWKKAMEKSIVENQRRTGCLAGSWDPEKDPWGDNGGRIYSTALLTLCLEVFYRYENILGARF